MNSSCVIDYLKSNLSEKRFEHTMGVAKTAVELAKIYSADAEKAYLAGLLHDCYKEKKIDLMLETITKYGGVADVISENSPALLHGIAGAYFARDCFNIDEEIFDAIRYHTTGKANMSLLTKIIYIADYIEPTRCFPGVEDVRNLAFSDLDKAIVKSCTNVIIHTVSKGGVIHPDTVNALNYLLLNNRGADDEEIRI